MGCQSRPSIPDDSCHPQVHLQSYKNLLPRKGALVRPYNNMVRPVGQVHTSDSWNKSRHCLHAEHRRVPLLINQHHTASLPEELRTSRGADRDLGTAPEGSIKRPVRSWLFHHECVDRHDLQLASHCCPESPTSPETPTDVTPSPPALSKDS